MKKQINKFTMGLRVKPDLLLFVTKLYAFYYTDSFKIKFFWIFSSVLNINTFKFPRTIISAQEFPIEIKYG